MIVLSYVLMTLLMFLGLFLIGLILLQRGRGGGLAGAFGGMGGQSAFGTKAGDVFTKITIGVASAWILLCAGNVIALHNAEEGRAPASLFNDTVKKTEGELPLEKGQPLPPDGGGPGPAMNPAPAAANQAAPATNQPKPESNSDEAKKGGDEKEVEPQKPEENKPGEKKPEETQAPHDKQPAAVNDAGNKEPEANKNASEDKKPE